MPKKQRKQKQLTPPVVKKTRPPPSKGIKRQTTLFSSWGLKQKTQSPGAHCPTDSTAFNLSLHDVRSQGQQDQEIHTDDLSFILDEDEMIECFKLLDDNWVQETIDMFPEIFD